MIGLHISSYKIMSLIGEGGMGNVYLGVHAIVGKQVAIKVLNQTLFGNPEIRGRFRNEASVLARLHHQNIVVFHDYIETKDNACIVMEYVEGLNLDEYISKISGPIPESKALRIFLQILSAMQYAHSHNVIHRDIKPSNIIIGNNDTVKILDFGISKILDDSSFLKTRTGLRIGTIYYMSPEHVLRKSESPVDEQSDIYSLGITLFQMLTANLPFSQGLSEFEVLSDIVYKPLPTPRLFYPSISEELITIINKCTRKSKSERYSSCDEIADLCMVHLEKGGVISNTGKTKPNVTQNSSSATTPTKSLVAKKRKKWELAVVIPVVCVASVVAIVLIIFISINYFNRSSAIEEAAKEKAKQDSIAAAQKEYEEVTNSLLQMWQDSAAAIEQLKDFEDKEDKKSIDQYTNQQFSTKGKYHEGLATVEINGKYGYVDFNDNVVISAKFDFAYDFENGKARVIMGKKVYFIDRNGNFIDDNRKVSEQGTRLCVYLNEDICNNFVSIYIDGIYHGQLTKYNTGLPACGSKGTLTVDCSVGNHTVIAECPSGEKWKYNVYVKAGECRKVVIGRSN